MTKICIDAGHGGKDSGAIGSGQQEKDNVLRIAKNLKEKLSGYGYKVMMTRDKDEFIPLNTRADIANNTKCDFFLSIHQNSARSRATGLEALIHTKTSLVAENIAKEMIKQISEVTGIPIRRGNGLYRRNVTVITRTEMPAVLLELGFINNADDMQAIEQNEDEIVQRICNVIKQQFPQKEKETSKAPKLSRNLRYRSRGDDVKQMQQRLQRHKVDVGKIDGVYGKKTESGVRAFQQARLKEGRDIGKVDGVVGKKTWSILWE